MFEAVKLITPLWSAALKSESDAQGRWDKSFITALTLRNSFDLAYLRTAGRSCLSSDSLQAWVFIAYSKHAQVCL